MGVRIALLGQPLVVAHDRSRTFPLPRKTLNVLGYLILNRRRATTRDSVAFSVFPDDDEDAARGALRRNLSELLAAFPDARACIEADGERIVWRADAPAVVDVIAFEEAIRTRRDADAIAEYGGALLPTIYDDWAGADRERLRDAFHDALGKTVAAERARRQYDVATATAHRLLDDDPWREDIVRQLMAIRYEAGDRAGALAAFERFATLLRDEMKAEPMPETLALRDALLRGALLPTSEPERAAAGAPAVEPAPTLPFVGREATFERAHRAWQVAAAGHASVLFVSGEAGVGKSRFTTELVRAAEREGGFIVRGYTSSGGEQRPYEAIAEALYGTALFDEHAGSVLSDDRAARLRFFESVCARLRELARRRPVIAVLEDLHWAGAATLELLEFLARHLDGAAVLLVVTLRSDERASSQPLRSLERRLHGNDLAIEIALDRLSLDDATRAARSALTQTVDEAALARMLAWVDGVPLLLVEAVRDLAAGRSSSASSMAALVDERFARLSTRAEMALAFGAVIGERFDLDTLVAATGWRDGEAFDAIGEGMEFGFVRAAAHAPGLAFGFTHDLVRIAASDRISGAALTRAHGLVARAVAAQFPGEASQAGRIARHFAAAGENDRAAGHYRDAARYALSVFANDDARAAATAGLDLCDESERALRYELLDVRESSLARIGATDERRADAVLLVSLADGDENRAIALGRLCEAYLTDTAGRRDALTQLATVAGASALAERTHFNASARHAFREGEFAQAHETALRLATLCEQAGDARSAMKARFLGIACHIRLGSFVQAEAAVEALRPVMEASDDVVLAWEFYVLACVTREKTGNASGLADAHRALECALRAGDRFAEARSRHNIAACASRLGSYGDAIAEFERAVDAYRDVGDAPGISDATLNVVAVLVLCGDFDRAQAVMNALPEESSPHVALRFRLVRGFLARCAGRFAEAEQHQLDARRRADELGASYDRARAELELALALAGQHRIAEAVRYLEEALKTFAAMGETDIEVEALALSAQLHAAQGDATGARDVAQRVIARTSAKRMQSLSIVAWHLAVAFATIGDAHRADEFAAESAAAAIDDTHGMSADLTETYLRLPWHQEAIAHLWKRGCER